MKFGYNQPSDLREVALSCGRTDGRRTTDPAFRSGDLKLFVVERFIIAQNMFPILFASYMDQ